MKLPLDVTLSVPRLPQLPKLPLQLRFVFRGAFLLLLAATLGLALAVLVGEKQRSHRAYVEALDKNRAQIAARLRHPTGALLLLNPAALDRAATPLKPLLLPFAAIDFDDRGKAQQAAEMAGCGVLYPDGASLCAGVGRNPYAGAYVYLVGSFAAGELVPHRPGELDFSAAHRAEVTLQVGAQRWGWVAPYQAGEVSAAATQSGRLVGFDSTQPVTAASRPQRDFRAWLWQEPRCFDGGNAPDCLRRTLLSLRLPVEPWRAALASPGSLVWPPADLDQTTLRFVLRAPGDGAPVFDSDSPGAHQPFAAADLRTLLQPGERLSVQREGTAAPLLQLQGADSAAAAAATWVAPLIDALVRRIPVADYDRPVQSSEPLALAGQRLTLTLQGDLRPVNRQLAAVTTRLAAYVAAMLIALLLAWLALELMLMRRITLLTRRAAAVSQGIKTGQAIELDLKDLRGSDELAVLAAGLRDLLARVNDDLRREQIRARQEKDQWHAVGHEIMSPLQSLMVLHPDPADPSARYVARMQQAVRVLYGQASPSEAFAATTLELGGLDLEDFLRTVAANAGYAGIDRVQFDGTGAPLPVQADEHSLEDVLGHLLRNAQRWRVAGSAIRIGLRRADRQAIVTVANRGPAIEPAMLERIFEYGVFAPAEGEDAGGQRGQGLFVARTYLAKMGGAIGARNVDGGVEFEFSLPLSS